MDTNTSANFLPVKMVDISGPGGVVCSERLDSSFEAVESSSFERLLGSSPVRVMTAGEGDVDVGG